jgi:hypothetical protein
VVVSKVGGMETTPFVLPPDSPVLAARAALGKDSGETWRLCDAELTASVRELVALRAQVDAALVAAAGEAAACGTWLPSSPSPTAWLSQLGRMDRRDADALLRLADAARKGCAETLRGMRLGLVTAAHAHIITTTLAALPDGVTPEERDKLEDLLVDSAGMLRPAELREAARTALETFAARTPTVDDPDEAAAVAEEHARAEEARANRRRLALRQQADGMWNVRGLLTPEAGAAVHAALDSLAKPQPEPATGDSDGQGDADGEGGATPESGAGEGDHPGTRDMRTKAQRYADALHELAMQALDFGALAQEGAERPHVTMTVTYETLLRLAGGAGLLDVGGIVAAGDLRRILCDCTIVPVVLGGASEILDVGRSARTYPRALRRAVAARDQGCVRPGCHKPVRATHVHHMQHWADGGPTTIDNAALLCHAHHREVHLQGWQLRLAANGYPELIPPPAIDPLRRPIQHTRFKLQRLRE